MKHRFEVQPKDDYELAKLWVFANENKFMIFPTISKYIEFHFVYKRLIVDLDHRTIQMDGAEVVGGWGNVLQSVDSLIIIFKHMQR